MDAPAPPPATPSPSSRPDPDRAAWWRFGLVLVLAAVVAAVAWKGRGEAATTATPEGLFLYVRERALAGDGDALWRILSKRGQEDFAGFIEGLRTSPDGPEAVAYREFLGISNSEFVSRSPRQLLGVEMLAAADRIYAGAQIVKVDRRDEDTAVLYLFLPERGEKQWHLEHVDGAWTVHDLNPFIANHDGSIIAKPGPMNR